MPQLSSSSRRVRVVRRLIFGAVVVPLTAATMSVFSVPDAHAGNEMQGSITLLGPDMKQPIGP